MSNEEGQEGSPSSAPSLSPLVTKVTIVSPPRRSTAGSAPPGKAVRADAAAAVPEKQTLSGGRGQVWSGFGASSRHESVLAGWSSAARRQLCA